MSGRADKIISNGWEQWVTVHRNKVPPSITDQDEHHSEVYIVATQSCDLACGCFSAEPYVEMMGINFEGGKANPNLVNAKNSRVIHLPLEEEGYLEVKSSSRFLVSRSLLEEFCPDQFYNISEQQKNRLITWISSRYYRPAFSDEFMEAWKKFNKKLHEHLKRNYDRFGDCIFCVLVKAVDNVSQSDYRAEWLIVYSESMLENISEPAGALSHLEEMIGNLTQVVTSSIGINGTVELVSTSSMSLEDMLGFKRIFLDDICHRTDPSGELSIS